jgi:lysophospholipase L1-like esterase
MKKLFITILFVLFLAVIILLSFHKNNKPVAESDYQMEFGSDLTSSNLYAPDNLKVDKIGSESAELTWNFKTMHLVTEKGVAPEYANLSGYRIYRNGCWYIDLSGPVKSFSDTDLYPGKNYSYEVSALTFDNKIEGQKSEKLEIKTGGEVTPIINNLKIGTVLIEGDSIARGQRANPGDGWADQVGAWLTKNGSKKIINDAKDNTFSFDLEKRVGAEITSTKPDMLIVGVGMNDLFSGNGNYSSYSLGEYLNNYKEIIQLCSGLNIKVVIVGITPAKGKSEKVAVWNSALEDLAYNTNSIYIPTDYLSEKDLIDSIHPSQEAHNEIAQKMISVLYTNFR